MNCQETIAVLFGTIMEHRAKKSTQGDECCWSSTLFALGLNVLCSRAPKPVTVEKVFRASQRCRAQ